MFCSDCKNRDTTFGLRSGQIHGRQCRLIERADWYSGTGDWLGCGDLTTQDIERIQACLEPGEIFFVINRAHEGHAANRPFGWQRNLTYIRQYSTHIFQPNHRYVVDDHLAGGRGTSIKRFFDMVFVVFSRIEALRHVASTPSRQRALRVGQ